MLLPAFAQDDQQQMVQILALGSMGLHIKFGSGHILDSDVWLPVMSSPNIANCELTCHRPISASWTYPAQSDSRCLDEGLTNTVLAAFHCNADFIVTVWPIPMILKLQLPKRVRIYIIALLNVGFTVTIAGNYNHHLAPVLVLTTDY